VHLPPWLAVGIPIGDEAVVVPSMAVVLAAAKARDVMKNLGIPRSERVHGAHDVLRSRGSVGHVRERRKRTLISMRSGRLLYGHRHWRRLGRGLLRGGRR
jgi:hypothetical protein